MKDERTNIEKISLEEKKERSEQTRKQMNKMYYKGRRKQMKELKRTGE